MTLFLVRSSNVSYLFYNKKNHAKSRSKSNAFLSNVFQTTAIAAVLFSKEMFCKSIKKDREVYYSNIGA